MWCMQLFCAILINQKSISVVEEVLEIVTRDCLLKILNHFKSGLENTRLSLLCNLFHDRCLWNRNLVYKATIFIVTISYNKALLTFFHCWRFWSFRFCNLVQIFSTGFYRRPSLAIVWYLHLELLSWFGHLLREPPLII